MNINALRMGLLTAGLLASGAAQATLIDRGGGLLYDTVLNVTWLQNANYAQDSGYDADGVMDWFASTTWAANLQYYDSVRQQTLTGWRLTKVIDTGTPGCNYSVNGTTDCGYNIRAVGDELSYMYYVNLGLHGYVNTSGNYDPQVGIFGNGRTGGMTNVGLVHNLRDGFYWTGTAYTPSPTDFVWEFVTDGNQTLTAKGTPGGSAWLVRDGDVVAAPAPEPATLALALIGAGLAGLRRRWYFSAL